MLQLRQVCKEYVADGVVRQALKDINLEVSAGERVAIMGPNGSGKTSLGNVVVADAPTRGQVILDGQDVTALHPHKRAAFSARVTQSPFDSLSDALSIEEHFALVQSRLRRRSSWRGVSRQVRDLARNRLRALRPALAERLRDGIVGLSGGERQLVALAVLTIEAPRVLVLDEPTSALDLEGRKVVQTAALDLILAQEVTTLWITHDIDEALHVATRLLFMADGRVVHDLSTHELTRTSRGTLSQIMSDLVLGTPVGRLTATPSQVFHNETQLNGHDAVDRVSAHSAVDKPTRAADDYV